MYHFFVTEEQISSEYVSIVGKDINHIKNVLRLKTGEQIRAVSSGVEYTCQIEILTNQAIRCKIITQHNSESELPIEVVLFQGMPKKDKFEWIIQKNVELGIARIVPVEMERSIVRYSPDKIDAKVMRWNEIALTAAKQSKRGLIPEIHKPISFQQLIAETTKFDKVLVPYEQESDMTKTKQHFSDLRGISSIGLIIGPEGGFSDSEIAALVTAGCDTLSLGRRILRTETAGLVAMSILAYNLEEV